MMEYIWLIPLLPLAGSAINGLAGRRFGKTFVSWVACGSAGLSFALAIGAALRLFQLGPAEREVTRAYFTWIASGDFIARAEFLLDPKLQAVMMQEYRGDITLVPPRRLIHILNLVSSHSPDKEREFLVIGQRLTWPYLEMIKTTTAISRTFRDCIARLQAPAVRTRRKPGRARRNGARHG